MYVPYVAFDYNLALDFCELRRNVIKACVLCVPFRLTFKGLANFYSARLFKHGLSVGRNT